MRRSIGLLLAGLALLIQVLVPVAAAGMVRAGDPLANAVICSSDGAVVPAHPDDAQPRHDCGLCLVCAFVHAPAGDRLGSTPIVYAAAIATVVWSVGGDDIPRIRHAHDGPARGPPALV